MAYSGYGDHKSASACMWNAGGGHLRPTSQVPRRLVISHRRQERRRQIKASLFFSTDTFDAILARSSIRRHIPCHDSLITSWRRRKRSLERRISSDDLRTLIETSASRR